jgi:hypothetical protein
VQHQQSAYIVDGVDDAAAVGELVERHKVGNVAVTLLSLCDAGETRSKTICFSKWTVTDIMMTCTVAITKLLSNWQVQERMRSLAKLAS